MSIILFILILLVLVLIHELGHFLVAKYFNIRVDEFGVGFPPRAATLFKHGETKYTLNWIPFGGFVKIFGENAEEGSDAPDARGMQSKPKRIQALVLVAGVVMNFLFAWLILTVGLAMHSIPLANPLDIGITNAHTYTTIQDFDGTTSPAQNAGLHLGDKLFSVSDGTKTITNPSPVEFSTFVHTRGGEKITIVTENTNTVQVIPVKDAKTGFGMIGVSLGTASAYTVPLLQAPGAALKLSVYYTKSIVGGLYSLIRGHVATRDISGPIGIASLVGVAVRYGFGYILNLTALISLNLAVINILPFPALDGGRLVFLVIEKIRGARLPEKVYNLTNNIGFVILILLMVVISIHDVLGLFVK